MINTPPPPHSSLSPLCTFFGADPIGGAWVLGLGAGRGGNERFSLGGFAPGCWTAWWCKPIGGGGGGATPITDIWAQAWVVLSSKKYRFYLVV